MKRKAVFLDRDGVINRAVVRNGRPYPPASLDDFEILPGVPDALATLKAANFLLIVATNQPDVARGTQSRDVVERMHSLISRTLPIDDIKVCWDIDGPTCTCYKPKPGMLLDAAQEHDIDLKASYMVGDRWRDVGCGRAAGCFTILIDRRYDEPMVETPDAVCGDLSEAASLIRRMSEVTSTGSQRSIA
jgi:D-glycero-D-manno-heptose 1,7-bisphosphate phosphatase